MKKFILFILFYPTILNAQTTVKGIILEPNSGNKIIEGVQVTAMGAVASEVSDNSGKFQLNFNYKKIGDKIKVDFVKAGYEIFNKDLVDNWVIVNNTNFIYRIKMCHVGQIAKDKSNYYKTIFESSQKEYERKLSEAKLDVKTNSEKIQLLELQNNEMQKNIEEFANKFAYIDIDDCDSLYVAAITAIKEGKIDEAIKLFNSVDSKKELEKIDAEIKNAINQKKEAETRIINANEKKQQRIKEWAQEADFYVTQYMFDKAKEKYEFVVKADSTNFENLFKLTSFLWYQNKRKEAKEHFDTLYLLAKDDYEKWQATMFFGSAYMILFDFEKANHFLSKSIEFANKTFSDNDYDLLNVSLSMPKIAIKIQDLLENKNKIDENILSETISNIKILSKQDSVICKPLLASVSLIKAIIQNLNNNFKESEKSFNEALALYRGLASKEPLYNKELANTLTQFGNAQNNMKNYINSEENLLEAKNIYEDLIKLNSNMCDDNIGIIYFNLGVLYNNINQKEKAELYFFKTLNIFNSIEIDNDTEKFFFLGASYYAIGNIQNELKKYDEAESNILIALSMFDKFVVAFNFFGINSIDLKAETFGTLASVKQAKGEFEKAEQNYIKSLNIYKELSKENPQIYNLDYANTLNDLSVLQVNTEQFDKAQGNCNEALNIFLEENKKNPKKYNSNIAESYARIAEIQHKTDQFQKAEESYSIALNILRSQVGENSNEDSTVLSTILFGLARLQDEMEQYEKAKASYTEALAICKSLSKEKPQEYNTRIACIIGELAFVYYKLNLYDLAEANFIDALNLHKALAKSNPEKFHSELAFTLSNFALLQQAMGKYEDAKMSYLEALNINRILSNENPNFYGSDVVEILKNLADLQQITNQFDKAKENYIEALTICKSLPKEKQHVYSPDIAYITGQLAFVYYKLNLYDLAETNFIDALSLHKTLAKSNPKEYNSGLVLTLNNFAFLKQTTGKYKDAENSYVEALNIIIDLRKEDYQTYNSELANNYGNISWAQIFQKQFNKAEYSARKGLETDNTQTWIKTNLAHALLFQNKYEEARNIYLELKDQKNPQDESKIFREIFLNDFDELEKAGITHSDITKIRELLK